MRRSPRGLIALAATVAVLFGGQAAIGSAQAATRVSINPATPSNDSVNAPFGQTDKWGPYMVWVYKNVPAFSLKPGDTISFDLSLQNDVDIQLQIAMAATTTNGGNQNAAAFTQVVPNTQLPANPRGNTTNGDYELRFTSTAAFSFPGGGLLIRFGNPAGAFAGDLDATGDEVLMNDALPSDSSGHFVEIDVRDTDGTYPWNGDVYLFGIGGFQLDLADVPPPPPVSTPNTPAATPTTKKKCKKKHRSAAVVAKKCKKKRR